MNQNLKISNEQFTAFQDAKQLRSRRFSALCMKMFFMPLYLLRAGGGVDLYPFCKCIPGTVFATMELIQARRKRSDS